VVQRFTVAHARPRQQARWRARSRYAKPGRWKRALSRPTKPGRTSIERFRSGAATMLAVTSRRHVWRHEPRVRPRTRLFTRFVQEYNAHACIGERWCVGRR